MLADLEQKESRWDASEAALAEAGALFSTSGDLSGEAEVLRLRGFGALFRHEYEEATELLEQALARFDELDDQRGVAWALQNLAWCAFYSGRAEEAESAAAIAPPPPSRRSATRVAWLGERAAGLDPLPAGLHGRGRGAGGGASWTTRAAAGIAGASA